MIPRTALPLFSPRSSSLSSSAGLRVANVFHAGDGNLHPLVLYDRAIRGQEERALDLSYRILRLCVDNGGSITGEHGVGKEKQEALGYMFSEPDLAHDATGALRLRSGNIANPGQSLSTPAPLRRKARTLYAASAGNGRDRGDLLMSDIRRLTLDKGWLISPRSSGRSIRSLRGDTLLLLPRTRSRSRRFCALPQQRTHGDAHRRQHQAGLGQSASMPDIELSLYAHERSSRARLAGHDLHRGGRLRSGLRCRLNYDAIGRWSRSIRCGRTAPRSAASIATNDSGALRLKFGGLRDLIIGMTVVLADGTIAKIRRQGGQKCCRLRSAQADDGQLRHAGRDR